MYKRLFSVFIIFFIIIMVFIKFTLEGKMYIKCLFYANQTSKNQGWDVKEIKILRVFAHTNLCRTKKMPYICPVL